jgi:hypothetical protein
MTLQSPDYSTPPADAPKHSGFGIASFAIGLASAIADFLLLVVGVLADQNGHLGEDFPAAVLVGLSMFAVFFLNAVGLVLGIVGVLQANRHKVFPGLGIAFNIVVPAGMLLLILIGTLSD